MDTRRPPSFISMIAASSGILSQMGLIFPFSYLRPPKLELTQATMARHPSGSSWLTFAPARESILEAEADRQWLLQEALLLLQHQQQEELAQLKVAPHLFFQAT